MTRLFLTTALVAGLAMPAMAVQLGEGEKLAENQSYTFWLLDAIKTTDPHKDTDVAGSDVIRQLFEGLLNEDATGAPIPGVATGFDVSDDKLTYTFKLRPEAKWSNGDPVTANDFVYSWRRLADPATASEYAWFIELMNVENATAVVKGEKKPEELGVKALDDHTLEVKLTTPTPYFPKMVTHASTFPVNQKVVEAEGDSWTQPGKLVGNGAYVLTSHDLGVQISMEKSPTYWDADNVVMEKIKGLTVNDNNIALTRYQAGELDRVQIPAGQYPRLKQEFPDQAISIPYACTYAYLLNVGPKGPEALKDVRVRKALSYAMQRDIVVDQILQGGQKPAYNWTHWAIEGFEMPEIDYAGWSQAERLEKAKALLAEAGYGPDKPLKLTLQYNTDENHKKIAVAAQQFYKQLGIDLTLNNVEWKVHTDRMQAGDFEMARYAWCADYNEASTFLDYFRSTGMNCGKYSNPEFDKLMDESKTAENPNVQYTAAEKLLAEDMPLVPIYQYAKVDMIRDDIKGLPTENVMNDWYAKDIYRIQK
ncbi:peptide ABC transporter substrate-binding protein [Paracoccus sp. SMMA_5_TC]|uniref:peptide ABC transporter substrate-binding protein n=1 Tax=Paracoccus sp. SMMA_5_TC TaxID=2654280 RepID=UPI0021E10A6C|nr:peptide ABC transporter substrate-binding protein [Paracoccus sp. SMMA_5_TC]UXU80397.1 peptide ABC transporter substrate-binding protein [Paracoccus sp. SMMA_5_TC]